MGNGLKNYVRFKDGSKEKIIDYEFHLKDGTINKTIPFKEDQIDYIEVTTSGNVYRYNIDWYRKDYLDSRLCLPDRYFTRKRVVVYLDYAKEDWLVIDDIERFEFEMNRRNNYENN